MGPETVLSVLARVVPSPDCPSGTQLPVVAKVSVPAKRKSSDEERAIWMSFLPDC